jgi:hypothetical protein
VFSGGFSPSGRRLVAWIGDLVMNFDRQVSDSSINLPGIDAMVRRARKERAQAMRTAVVKLGRLFKRLAVLAQPSRQRLPQAGAWAYARAGVRPHSGR